MHATLTAGVLSETHLKIGHERHTPISKADKMEAANGSYGIWHVINDFRPPVA